MEDMRVLARLKVDNIPNEASNDFAGLILRASWSGTDLNGYLCMVKFRIGIGQEIHIRELREASDHLTPIALVSESLADQGADYLTSDFWMEAIAQGSLIQARAWLDGNEPPAFLSVTNTTYTEGGAGIAGELGLPSNVEIRLKSLVVEPV